MWGTILGFLGSLALSALNNRAQNRNIQQSLNAQKEENEKMREYNMGLARQQNQYNVEQWDRENQALQSATIDEREYNSPEAQIQRLRDAGLNADMYYGNGSLVNTSSAYGVASSPSMTAGAAASPMDWSALAGKKTIGSAIMDSLAIEQARANVRKTNAEADISSADADVRPRLNSLGLSKLEVDTDFAQELSNLYNSQHNLVDLQADYENWKRQLRGKFGDKYVESVVNKISNEANISSKQLEFEIETLAQRIVGVNAENTPLVNIQGLSNQNLKLVLEVIRTLLK